MKFNDVADEVLKLSSQYEDAYKLLIESKRRKAEAERWLSAKQEAQAIVQNVCSTIQMQVHSRVSQIVTDCLCAVFPEDHYEFEIDFVLKRGKTEAVLQLCRNEVVLTDPINQAGGGVIDVACFALRLAAVLLAKPHVRRLVVLDEPFKFVSVQYRENVAELLTKLSTELDMQFLIVTHMKELALGKIIQLTKSS